MFLKDCKFILLSQKGSLLYFSIFFIDNSFNVRFQVLEQIYLIDDFPEFVLNVGSIIDPVGIL